MGNRNPGHRFTPGPWVMNRIDEGVWHVESEQGGWCVCETAGCCGANDLPDEEESDANARLIAAAPFLYEAARSALKYIEDENPGAASGDAWVAGICDRLRDSLALVDASAGQASEKKEDDREV